MEDVRKYIISVDEFNVSKLTYGTPKDIGTTGGRMIPVFNEDGSPIIIQTPEMLAAYPLKDWEGNHNYTLDLSFLGKDDRPNLMTFFNKLSEFDDKLINDGIENGLTWLRKKVASPAVAEMIFTRMVRFARDKNTREITDKYPATFKMKVPYKDNKFLCEAYNNKKELIDLASIDTKGAKITAIVQCLGIWVAGGKYGVSWKALILKVSPKAAITGFLFKDDNDTIKDEVKDDESVDEDLAGEIANKLNVKNKKKTVESSDEEEEEEEEEEDDELEAKPIVGKKKK